MAIPLILLAFACTVAIGAISGGGSRGATPNLASAGRRPPVSEHDSVIFPAGTEIPFRFLHGLQSGRDRAGAIVYAQTLGAFARDSCVVLAPFLALRGRITESHRGGWLGRRSELALRFDSLELAPGFFGPVDAVADSLEYVPPAALGDSGQVYGGRPHGGRVVAATLARKGLGVVGLAIIPAAALEGFMLFRRPAPVRLQAGEVGRLRLLTPIVLHEPASCERVRTDPDLAPIPLPEFVPHTKNRAGTGAGDPINFVFLGTLEALDTAFTRAGWDQAHAHTRGTVARAVEQAIRRRPAKVGAPVSTEYFAGRPQDAAYELPGPTAKTRHHIRVWRLDETTGMIVGSANEDIGLDFDPLRGRATHRVDPEIDRERDYLVIQLEAGGCADLLEFVTLPGAVTEAKTATGQQLATDGRTAVVRLRECRRRGRPFRRLRAPPRTGSSASSFALAPMRTQRNSGCALPPPDSAPALPRPAPTRTS